MARIKRHESACARRLSRRSREEKRRLSEGGGGAARVEEKPEPEPDYDRQNSQNDVMELGIEEIDEAYCYIFKYSEIEASLLMRVQEIVEATHELNESKSLLDAKISALKVTTRSPDSDNVKRIKFGTRRSLQLMDRINDLKNELAEVKLQQISDQVKYRSSLAIVDQHLSSQEANQGLLLGFLGHVWRLA